MGKAIQTLTNSMVKAMGKEVQMPIGRKKEKKEVQKAIKKEGKTPAAPLAVGCAVAVAAVPSTLAVPAVGRVLRGAVDRGRVDLADFEQDFAKFERACSRLYRSLAVSISLLSPQQHRSHHKLLRSLVLLCSLFLL